MDGPALWSPRRQRLSATPKVRRWPVVAAFGLVAAGFVAGSLYLLSSMREEALREADASLGAVAALKVAAVSEWIDDRIHEATFACSYPSVVAATAAAVRGRLDPGLRQHVREILWHFSEHGGYWAVGVYGPAGEPIALAGVATERAPPVVAELLEAAKGDPLGAAARLEVDDDGRGALDVVVVRPAGGATSSCALRADASPMLQEVLESWPVPSPTASAALLRVMGDEVQLILPERDRSRAVARAPLSRPDLPAVRAVRGERGLIAAVTQLGTPILIKALPIQGTEWLLRTRVDRAEAMARATRPTLEVAALVVAFLVGGGLLLARWWRDEGRRVAAEEALRQSQVELDRTQRLAGLGRLAAGVAHEINNPLASVIGNLAFALERLDGSVPEVQHALEEARDSAQRVGGVVRGLRTLSRTGDARGPVDVRRELDVALRLAQHEVRHRGELEVRIGPLPQVVAEAHVLAQVFLNFLVNAAQALPEGRAEGNRVTVDARTDVRGWAAVEIRDTGVGIPPAVLERIFEPFFTTKPLGEGTGLGLSIAHGIVTAAGGRIEVQSRPGEGTTFRVLLPPAPGDVPGAEPLPVTPPPPAGGAPAGRAAARSAAPSPAPSAAPTPGPTEPGPESEPEPAAPPTSEVAGAVPQAEAGRRLRVLLVDDEPLVARTAGRLLAAYEVTTEGSAAGALRRFEAGERFDAILCDLMMPQMTGMELHARAAAAWPEQAARFVFLTGGAFTEAAEAFLLKSGNAWIEKPFDGRSLSDAVERAASR